MLCITLRHLIMNNWLVFDDGQLKLKIASAKDSLLHSIYNSPYTSLGLTLNIRRPKLNTSDPIYIPEENSSLDVDGSMLLFELFIIRKFPPIVLNNLPLKLYWFISILKGKMPIYLLFISGLVFAKWVVDSVCNIDLEFRNFGIEIQYRFRN